jgi:hypothetical protein
LQPSDTAYPRFNSRPSETELERFYTLTENERTFCNVYTRSATRLGFVLLLKAYQRLGYFVTSDQIPGAIIDHIAAAIGERGDQDSLWQYDVSQARRKHLSAVRQFLEVKQFDEDGKRLLRQTFGEAALTKEDVIDIINIGIEVLVRYRYELPAFDTLVREARAQRVATNQTLLTEIHTALGDGDRVFLDALFVVSHLLKAIPVVKVHQWTLEGISLDAASMVNMEPNKRYAVALAVIRQRIARVTDDLCDIFCKQMQRVLHSAEEALKKYLTDNQEKTDEILRRFASLEGLLKSDQPADEQLKGVRQTVMARPDLCEFSRLHAEYGGKNEYRFMWHSSSLGGRRCCGF